VCERENETERQCVCERERMREKETERECVCERERMRQKDRVCV